MKNQSIYTIHGLWHLECNSFSARETKSILQLLISAVHTSDLNDNDTINAVNVAF